MTLTPASSHGNATSIDGVTVTGTPSAGQVITATSATAAHWAAGGGGGVTTREQLHAAGNVTIANGANGVLTWAKSTGSDLVDLTDPTAPAIVTAGVYAVGIQVAPAGAITTGGSFIAKLELDANGEDPEIDVTSAAATAAVNQPRVGNWLTYYIPAAGVIVVTVANLDGVASVDYRLSFASIQRIS